MKTIFPEINERLEKIIDRLANGSRKKFAELIGVSPQVINRNFHLDPRSEEPKYPIVSTSIIDKVLNKFPEIDSNWLLTGEGAMLKSTKNEAILATNLQTDQIPLVSQYAYAGYLCGFADEEYMETLPTIPWDVTNEPKGTYLAFEVKGDSMDDRSYESILEGDILYCRRLKESLWEYRLHFNVWDFVIVHKTDGILVKRIINHDVDTGNITIHSLNSLYEDKIINIQDIAQIFNVVEIKRKRRR